MIRNYIVWLTCIFYVLAAPMFASASVLCIGEDGHTAIERSFNGNCFSQHVEHSLSKISPETLIKLPTGTRSQDLSIRVSIEHLFEEDSHCGPCTDIGLNQFSASIHPARDDSFIKTIPIPLQFLSSYLVTLSSSTLNQIPQKQFIPAKDNLFVDAPFLSSTVLLI